MYFQTVHGVHANTVITTTSDDQEIPAVRHYIVTTKATLKFL